MAEEVLTTTETTGESSTNQATPDVETLMAEIAQLKAEKAKSKTDLDAALKKAGDATKALRAKQTAEEQAEAERAEQQRIIDEENKSMREELNRIKAMSAYKDINENDAEKLIQAVSEGDHTTVALIIKNEVDSALKSAKAEWLKGRPQANTTSTSTNTMTREQIMAIKDTEQRLAMIAQNMNLFN